MKRGKVSQLLSMTLALSMTLGMTSIPALADGEEVASESVVEATAEDETVDAVSDADEADVDTTTVVNETDAEETKEDAVSEDVAAIAVKEAAADDDYDAVMEAKEADESTSEEIVAPTEEETVVKEAAMEAVNETYVLMNIPYSVFYGNENAGIVSNLDAVSSATNKTGNYGKSGGAFHSATTASVAEDGTVTAVGGANGSQVQGAIWAVKAESIEAVAALGGEAVKDESSVTTATLGKGASTSQKLVGYETLTEKPAYSYYVLKEAPTNYLELKDGKIVAGTTKAEAKTGAEVEVSYGTNWGDVQFALKNIDDTSDKLINAMVLTAEDGTKVGLYHLDQIWANNSIAWKVDVAEGLDGKKIKNVRYYCMERDADLTDDAAPVYANYVYDYAVDASVAQVFSGKVEAEFIGADSIKVTGLPADASNLKAKVYYTTGGRNATYTYLTPLVVDPADDDIDPTTADVKDGVISIAPGAVTNKAGTTQTYGEVVDGTKYTIELSSDNYIIRKAEVTYDKATADAAAAEQKAAADKSAADAVIKQLNALKGSSAAASDKTAVAAARAAYNKLTAAQKALVSASVLKKLTDSESAVKKAEAAAVKKIAQKVKKVTPTSKTYKASKLKKKAQSFKLKATISGKGAVSFKKVSGNKKITVNKKGKVTVKKGLKKGTYTVKVKVSIAKKGNYKAASKTVKIKIKVKK